MEKEFKNPKQKLIIRYKFDNTACKDHTESLFCKSIVKAEKALSKRVKRNVAKATFFNATGAEIPLI